MRSQSSQTMGPAAASPLTHPPPHHSDSKQREGALNEQRGLLCEVLARRVVARMEAVYIGKARQESSERGEAAPAGPFGRDASHLALSKRWRTLDEDGDVTTPESALESAVYNRS